MAEVYKAVRGQKITKFIAREARPAVESAVLEIGTRAEGLLAEHHHSGDAYIDVGMGRIDGYVILNDERGQLAAMSIEYGRQPNEHGRGGMAGLFILHRAAHLQRKGR